MLEDHASLPNGKPYICKGYDWKEDVFISPVQSRIDMTCENRDLPWCDPLMSKQPCPCQKNGPESYVFLLMLMYYIQYVDHMLACLHWHFDVT